MSKQNITARTPGTRAKTRNRGPDWNKHFPVYFSKEEEAQKEGNRLEQTSFQQDIESLIDNQRASLAVPLTSKQQAQAAAAPAQAKDQTLTAPLTPEQKQDDLPPPMPVVKIKLAYKPMEELTKANHFVKYVPPVTDDHLMFDFAAEDYEITQRDREFLKANPGVGLSEKELERVIDSLEKCAFVYKTKQPPQMVQLLQQHCDAKVYEKLTKAGSEKQVIEYWKERRTEQNWHTFMRMFWETPDYNEPDISAAFRKKQEQQKVKTRPKIEMHRKKLQLGEKARDQTINFVLKDLLHGVFLREATKQAMDRVHNHKFDIEYEEFCKKQGLQPEVPVERQPMSYFQVKQPKDHLELKIKLPQPVAPPTPDDNSANISPRTPPTMNNLKKPHQNIPNKRNRHAEENAQIEDQRDRHRQQKRRGNNPHDLQNPDPEVQVQLNSQNLAGGQAADPSDKDYDYNYKQKQRVQTHQNGSAVQYSQRQPQPDRKNQIDPRQQMQPETPPDQCVGNFDLIATISRLLDLAKQNGTYITPKVYRHYSSLQLVDIKPKIVRDFDPGPNSGMLRAKQPESEDAEMSDVAEQKDMLDAIMKRDFVVRRGRNNRLLIRSIQHNVFGEQPESIGTDMNKVHNSRGHNFYVEKYENIWLGKRQRDPSESVGPGRKRVKFSNFELCMAQYPHLQKYANQRNLVQITPKTQHVKLVDKFDVRSLSQQAAHAQQAQNQVGTPVHNNEASGEYSQLGGEEDDQETARLATFDFVKRAVNRKRTGAHFREFLIEQCNPEPKKSTELPTTVEILESRTPNFNQVDITAQCKYLGEQFEKFKVTAQGAAGNLGARGYRHNALGDGSVPGLASSKSDDGSTVGEISMHNEGSSHYR